MQYKYMRDGLEDKYGFLELQDKILEIAYDVDKLCMENGIDYCLMGGSALGAKRHGGFIPWDDDLDIFMTPDNYERFRDVFNSKGDRNKYYLQECGGNSELVSMAKVRMNHTTYIEETLKEWNIHHGIYIDIFILHNCPDSTLKRYHQFLWAKYVLVKRLAIKGYSRRKGIMGFALKVMALFPNSPLIDYGIRQIYKYRNTETSCFCNFLGKAVFHNAIYNRDDFIPTERIKFEKIELNVPENLHDFLTKRYGDYMKIPSPERIKWEQHASYWNCNEDFTLHTNAHAPFVDEKKLI